LLVLIPFQKRDDIFKVHFLARTEAAKVQLGRYPIDDETYGIAEIVSGLAGHFRVVARAVAWIGLLAIVVLSVVPASERPVTGSGSLAEHFAMFALVAGAFALGYELALIRLAALALLFCAGIELLQIPLPTRHARLSDFAIDFVASCLAICAVRWIQKICAR